MMGGEIWIMNTWTDPLPSQTLERTVVASTKYII